MRITDILGKQTFTQRWSHMLWQAMGATGSGYKRHTMRNSGNGEDRRKDKLESNESKLMRQYRSQYKGAVNRKA